MNKNISTVDYTDSFNTFFVKDVDDIKQINKDNVKNALGIGVVTGAIAEAESTLTLTDSIEKPFELHLYGKSTQDGTPTPDNPIDITSVENPTLTINNGADLSQTKQFSYTLRGIEDVKDELIIYADGTGKLTQRVDTEDLGTKLWEISNKTDTFIQFQIATYNGLANYIMCNRLQSISTSDRNNKSGVVKFNDKYIRVSLLKKDYPNITDVNAFISWVEQKPLNVAYQLATPVTTELTAEQIGIILNTYNDTTNIFTDQSAGIKAVYTADTKGYIDRKFDELATALVAQASEQ